MVLYKKPRVCKGNSKIRAGARHHQERFQRRKQSRLYEVDGEPNRPLSNIISTLRRVMSRTTRR